ncbi:MAG TPA: hypothetical protein VGO91_05455 [Pyrinomonadaceae bacterium]|nr:hypothetical protein [Pyrinomonadaceae bacterium]
MREEQKTLFEVLVAGILNILFLALIALLLWPLGRLMLAFRLAKGYGILWIVVCVIALLVNRIQRFFRADIYTHADAYVVSNLVVSCFLQAGWAAFAALAVHSFVAAAPVWMVVVLYLAGVISCLITYFAVSAFYQGHIYKLVSLPLALVGFIVFSAWPASGRAAYGWFFDLF